MEKITSRDNRRLVQARKVRDSKVPGQIFIEGRRLADEALRSELVIDECFVADGFADSKIIDAISQRGSTISKVSNSIFASIADTKQPQGIILIAKRPKSSLATIETGLKESKLPLVIFLKEINNPSNLGAILRTVEAAGATGVIISTGSAEAFSPKALRASMGATFRIPILEDAEFENILKWAKTAKLTPTAAAAKAASNYTAIDWAKPRLLVLGSEAHGLKDPELEHIDDAIKIPMENDVESLNLAVSAGIILFEAKRQNA